MEEYKDNAQLKDVINKIEKQMEELKKALSGTNIQTIKAELENTKRISQELGVKIYEQSAKEQAAQAEAKNDSKVVDAEVVDEKK
jgi:molecular chaperone DnaK